MRDSAGCSRVRGLGSAGSGGDGGAGGAGGGSGAARLVPRRGGSGGCAARRRAGRAGGQLGGRAEAADPGIEQAVAELLGGRGALENGEPQAAGSGAINAGALRPAPGRTRPHDLKNSNEIITFDDPFRRLQSWRTAEKIVNGVKTI